MSAQYLSCFGWWGVASVIAWVAALAAVALAARPAKRRHALRWAVGLAVVGFVLARVQTAWQVAIVLDRTEELRAVREAQQGQQIREEQARRGAGENLVRFAEDAPGESVGAAILTADELTGRTGAATNAEPVWRAGGKQARAAGKVDVSGARLARDATGLSHPEEATSPTQGHALKLETYRLSARLSRANRLLAGLVLLAACGLAIVDYFRRFHRTDGAGWPLPLAGTWLTAHLSSAPSRVRWPARGAAADIQGRLEDLVRRGQTFLYVGDRVDGVQFAMYRVCLGRLRLWPLRVLVWGAGSPADAEFALDAVWFDRYAVTVPSAAAGALLPKLLDLLAGRAATHAKAARLPCLVWNAPVPEAVAFARLERLCARTGLCLITMDGRDEAVLQTSRP